MSFNLCFALLDIYIYIRVKMNISILQDIVNNLVTIANNHPLTGSLLSMFLMKENGCNETRSLFLPLTVQNL